MIASVKEVIMCGSLIEFLKKVKNRDDFIEPIEKWKKDLIKNCVNSNVIDVNSNNEKEIEKVFNHWIETKEIYNVIDSDKDEIEKILKNHKNNWLINYNVDNDIFYCYRVVIDNVVKDKLKENTNKLFKQIENQLEKFKKEYLKEINKSIKEVFDIDIEFHNIVLIYCWYDEFKTNVIEKFEFSINGKRFTILYDEKSMSDKEKNIIYEIREFLIENAGLYKYFNFITEHQ